jgi:hypothetical protein
VTLALFYWFRSVRLDEDDGGLRVRPLEPISFEVLDTLPMPHAFALKALLEALGNALLIAPADSSRPPSGWTAGGAFQSASVDRTTRYRLQPLLVVRPVLRFLRGHNVVH